MSTATQVRAEARKELRKEAKIDSAFTLFMDHAVSQLVGRGLNDTSAMEVIFTLADQLAEQETLPPFPDDRASYQEKGLWLVSASDFGFVEFAVEAVTES
jgi:hypothetical protein